MFWEHSTTDPHSLQSSFSNEDSMAHLDSIFTDPTDEDLTKINRIQDFMEDIPAREADFLSLYYFQHMNQTGIAKLFGVSQPTVCYRLQRAAKRIRFLLELPDLPLDVVTEHMLNFFPDPVDAWILIHMWETTCQSEAASRLGITQGKVRHRFMRSLDRLAVADKMQTYATVFKNVAANLNILREVQRPEGASPHTHYVA